MHCVGTTRKERDGDAISVRHLPQNGIKPKQKRFDSRILSMTVSVGVIWLSCLRRAANSKRQGFD